MTVAEIVSATIAIPASLAGVCAHMAPFLPAPTAPGWYALTYAFINAAAGNYLKARNQ